MEKGFIKQIKYKVNFKLIENKLLSYILASSVCE